MWRFCGLDWQRHSRYEANKSAQRRDCRQKALTFNSNISRGNTKVAAAIEAPHRVTKQSSCVLIAQRVMEKNPSSHWTQITECPFLLCVNVCVCRTTHSMFVCSDGKIHTLSERHLKSHIWLNLAANFQMNSFNISTSFAQWKLESVRWCSSHYLANVFALDVLLMPRKYDEYSIRSYTRKRDWNTVIWCKIMPKTLLIDSNVHSSNNRRHIQTRFFLGIRCCWWMRTQNQHEKSACSINLLREFSLLTRNW